MRGRGSLEGCSRMVGFACRREPARCQATACPCALEENDHQIVILGRSRLRTVRNGLVGVWRASETHLGAISDVPKGRATMRRIWLLATVVGLVFLTAAPASAGPRGELTSAFNNEYNDIRRGNGLENRPEGHINVEAGFVEICDDLVVGTWWSWDLDDKATTFLITVEISLDGAAMDEARTPPMKNKSNPSETLWGFTEGVPVLGTLEAGTHTLVYDYYFDGVLMLTNSTVIAVAEC